MKKVLALATLLVLAMTFTPAHAGSETQTYVANGLLASPIVKRGDVNLALGGSFANTGDPISIRVDDAAGPGVSFTVCQEGPATETEPGCGNGDDVAQSFCSTGGNQTLNTAFRASTTNRISVFIEIADPTTCDNIGTTGTVRLNW